jgi:hypothetical protein
MLPRHGLRLEQPISANFDPGIRGRVKPFALRDSSTLGVATWPTSYDRSGLIASVKGCSVLTRSALVSLFQVGREHIFDPFHECADSARQVAPMRYYQGHGEGPATKVR